MTTERTAAEPAPNSATGFGTTHWSTVLAAGDDTAPSASEALERLCRTYWLPVYAFIRHRGHGREEAEDLTQGFFEHLIEKHLASRADPRRGRFRNFLLKALSEFLVDDHRRQHALKRGGDRTLVPLDGLAVEERLAADTDPTPELAFAHKWALSVLDQVLALLQQESMEACKEDVFLTLSPYLQGDEGLPPYAAVARQLHLTEGAARVAVHRLRLRYRELLRAVVAQTVDDPWEIDDEIHFLFQVICR